MTEVMFDSEAYSATECTWEHDEGVEGKVFWI